MDVQIKNKLEINYYGYIIKRDGSIISPHGNELAGYYFTYPRSHVSIVIDGKEKKACRARLIYELFSGERIPRNKVIRFRDNDVTNVAFENLYLMERADFAKIQDNYNDKKFDEEALRKIRREYRRRKNKPSIRALCAEYNCSILTMQKALNMVK